MIPVTVKDAPTIEKKEDSSDIYLTIENVIPDPSSYKLFVKIDYYIHLLFFLIFLPRHQLNK